MSEIKLTPMAERLIGPIHNLEAKLVAKCDEILVLARNNNLTDPNREHRVTITDNDIKYVLTKPRAYVDREYRIEIMPVDSENKADHLFEYCTGLVEGTSFDKFRRRRNAPKTFAPYDHYITVSYWRTLQVMAFDVATKMYKRLRDIVKTARAVNRDFDKRFGIATATIWKGHNHDDRKGTHRKASKARSGRRS